jgi:hypothetical protein
MPPKDKQAPQSTQAVRRFAVALSFPGEARERVETIAEHLATGLGRDRILYDRFHEAEFARPNLDVYLQHLYHDDAELNVVFLCKDYETKEWCGLEWRAIRDLIKHRRQEIMLLRIDDGPVAGLFSIDGYIDISNRNDDAVADAILQRWTQQQALATNSQTGAGKEAPPSSSGTPRPLLKDTGKLPNRRTARYKLGLEKGERVHVELQTEHDIDFAICTPATYQRWRTTTKLTGSLHLARRTSNMAITLVAKEPGTHWVLIINNTRRKDPIGYTVEIHEH